MHLQVSSSVCDGTKNRYFEQNYWFLKAAKAISRYKNFKNTTPPYTAYTRVNKKNYK